MLLAVDVGNTQITLGVFEGRQLRADWRISTPQAATADELLVVVRGLFDAGGLSTPGIRGVIVASVVPDLDPAFRRLGGVLFDGNILFVEPGVRTGLPIRYDSPHDVGADRIVNAVAAVERYGAPVIVLDFGTATTFDVISPDGEYMGGVIAPGPAISAEALFQRAARLTRVETRRPEHVIGRNTIESIQSGLFHGYAGLVEGVVRRIRRELGREAPVVATGGLAQTFHDELRLLEAVEPGLTLEGLRLIWDMNRR